MHRINNKVWVFLLITIVFIVVIPLVILVGPEPGHFKRQSVNIQATKDNTLYEDKKGLISNGSGKHTFIGKTVDSMARRTLVKFDLVGTIPSDATIVAVSLKLHMSKTMETVGPQPAYLHRVLTDWGEGSSNAPEEEGAGATASRYDATWIHTFFNKSTWESEGGDFNFETSAVSRIEELAWYSWSSSKLVEDVQLWLEDPTKNFGWLLMGNEKKFPTSKRFDSREHPNEEMRPSLHITFE